MGLEWALSSGFQRPVCKPQVAPPREREQDQLCAVTDRGCCQLRTTKRAPISTNQGLIYFAPMKTWIAPQTTVSRDTGTEEIR